MLNAIATFLVAFLLRKSRRAGPRAATSPAPSRCRGLSRFPASGSDPRRVDARSTASSSSPILVGVLYWFVLGKTRFGFDLRATGRSESAAVASGVKVKRMVLTADGALRRAWPGSSACRCSSARTTSYGDTFQAGLGFAGIAIALLGRNNPIGIVFAALLWAFLDAQCNALQITAGVSDRLVLIIQGVIVLSVVIAYEVIRRANVRFEQRRVAQRAGRASRPMPTEGAPA